MEASKRSHEEKFVEKKLKMIAEIEGSLKTVRKRLKAALQSGQASTEDGKKVVESLVIYGEILCGYHEQALIGNCVKTLASLHSVYENMTAHLNDAMRRELIPIIDQLLLSFKGAKESKSRVAQCRAGYDRAVLTASKNPASDKTIQTLGESKREWERVTEHEMQRLCHIAEEHSLSSSAAFSTVLQDYIHLFSVANEFCSAISPDLDEFISFARDRQASRTLGDQVKKNKEDDLKKAKEAKEGKEECGSQKEEKHKRKFLQRPAMKKLSEVKKEHLDLKRMKSKLDNSIEGLSKDAKEGKDAKDAKEAKESKETKEKEAKDRTSGDKSTSEEKKQRLQKGDSNSHLVASREASASPSGSAAAMEEGAISVEEFEDTDSITFVVTPGVAVPQVRTATVAKLVERLTHEKYPDILFRQAFMVTYRSFATPDEVLGLLKARYSDDSCEMSSRIKLRVVATVKYWLESHPYDFVQDKELAESLEKFIGSTISVSNKTAGKQLLNAFNRVMNHKGDISALIRKTNVSSEAAPKPRIPTGLTEDTIGLKLLDAKEIARQLTVIESELYCAITPKECLNKSWSSKNKEQLAPNILGMITRFNLTCNWVITEVVQKVRLEQRVEVLRKFIRIAACLRKLNNFNGVMEIIAGINNSAVRRLKSTWAELDETDLQTIRELEAQLNHKGNYKVYRDLLRQSTPPIIPYLGIYLTDLTFIEDGNPDTIDGLVNFSKRQKIAKVVESIQRYQSPYNLVKIDMVHRWLCNINIISEEEAYAMSTKVEPRDTSEALEKMLVEEHRMRKAVRELQVKNEEYEAQELIQNNTISLLSRQLREQQKMMSEMKKALEHAQFSSRRAAAGTTWAPFDSQFGGDDLGAKLAKVSEMARTHMEHRLSLSHSAGSKETEELLAKFKAEASASTKKSARERASSTESSASDTEELEERKRRSYGSATSEGEEGEDERVKWGGAVPSALSSAPSSRAATPTPPASPALDCQTETDTDTSAAEEETTETSAAAAAETKSATAVTEATAGEMAVAAKTEGTLARGKGRIAPKRPAPVRLGSAGPRGRGARGGRGGGDGGGRGRGDGRGRGMARGRGRGAPGRPQSPAPAVLPPAASPVASPDVLRKGGGRGTETAAAAASPSAPRARIVRLQKSTGAKTEEEERKTVEKEERKTESEEERKTDTEESSGKTASPLPARKCKALFDFVAENPDELEFRKGDVLTIIDVENAEAETGEGWWIGELDGKRGFFQADYVQLLQ